jgi:uncharacterized protein YprB with RNaseH-like and TPR domain
VIRRTFQHVPGIGPWREKDLWARGFTDWSAFPATNEIVAVSAKVDEKVRARIAETEAALASDDLAALASLFPQREHWRLYPSFADDAVYFDIETDGKLEQKPTVVSLYSPQHGLEVFLQGRNLDELPEALAKHRVWVTFNGSCFDVPVLRTHFPHLGHPALHLDLRFICRRLGMGGGLKSIEDRFGLARPPHLKGANGADAVLLWRAYQRTADLGALRFLVEYNLYDAFQLRTLMDVAYNLAAEGVAFEDRVPVFERGDILYDVSKLLLSLGLTDQDARVLERVRRMSELEF